MSSPYPVLDNRPIDQWRVTELKEELKRRKLTTKGLKDDLIRRLDEALREEQDAAPSEADNDSDSAPGPEKERTESFHAEEPKDASDYMIDKKGEEKVCEVDVADSRGSLDGMKPSRQDLVDGAISTGVEEDQIAQITDVQTSSPHKEDEITEIRDVKTGVQVSVSVETSVQVSVSVDSVTALSGEDIQNSDTQNENGDSEKQLENHVSNSSPVEVKVSPSDPENQISEVSHVLGLEVQSNSVSTNVDEKTELNDNVIADDVKLGIDVKPEMMQLPSNSIVPDDGKSNSMDVEEPHDKKVCDEESASIKDENIDIVKTDGYGDYAEKLQLDRSPADDYMEEDVSEGKIADSKLVSDKIIDEKKETEVIMDKEVGSVNAAGDDVCSASRDTNVEDKIGPTVQATKRKALGTDADQRAAVASNDAVKRQRRWNSENLKILENINGDAMASTTPKEGQPSFRRSFSRSDSMAKEEAPKERVVPVSSKPATDSLKIDRFLRPFTLKAVQELLSKTGTVTNFWMDPIKTHCYVSFSSVEEATETRNAVYNLQWPPNGGRLLVAEFVDPQEVKVRVEAPPQSPVTPVSTVPIFSAAPPSVQPQPSPRELMQNRLLPPQPSPREPMQNRLLPPQPSPRELMQNRLLPPPPSLPPPPALSNPPLVREHLAVKERLSLPPPPPLPEKADPPIVTLDDLFRKTKATPRIYYLPLSEEQVVAKLKKQGKNIKQ